MLPEQEGLGLGFESSEAIIELAKFNIKELDAITLEINKNSIKLLEKLGFHFKKKVNPFEDNIELLLFSKNL
ncbi:MAG: GNAT family N-acetyltransferase [Lacinutrix sp.]|uniref:GNAT family N-acetyltransferase n=1 Tax=Lacinutrix sp. TaxID=1937692 RepID=UPI0030B745FD